MLAYNLRYQTMQSLQLSMMQMLLKVMSPTSLAYGNTMTFQKPQTPKDIQHKLKAGDIIFSRTKSDIYQIVRNYMTMKYDHVAVVLNDKQVLHVSPPIISKLDVSYIVDPRRQPLIIRPKVEDMQKFLTIIHNFLGEKYNMRALMQIGLRQLFAKLKNQEKYEFSLSGLKHSRICSDSVIYALIRSSSQIQKSLLDSQIKKTKYQHLGFFLPDEVAELLLVNGSEIILNSAIQNQYKIVSTLSTGGAKILNFLQKGIELGKVGKKTIENVLSMSKRQKAKPLQLKASISKLQIVNLLMSFANLVGFVTLSAKTRFVMMMMHTMILIGHYQEFKKKMWKKRSSL